MQHTFLPRYDLWIEIYLRSHTQLISNWCELGIGYPSRSVSRMHVFLFQWTVNGDNGADGHLAQRHVEGELRFQPGGVKNKRRMEESTVWDKQPKNNNAIWILAQVWLKWIEIYLKSQFELGSKKIRLKNPCFPLSVDCQWGQWGRWTSCTQTCGVGFQTKTRRIKKHEQNGGRSCLGDKFKDRQCNANSCPGMT